MREYVRDIVEAAVDTARRTVDAREMAAMPRSDSPNQHVDQLIDRQSTMQSINQ